MVLQGYEDVNLILKTSKGGYFIKLFSDFRDSESCNRYIDIMEKVSEIGINTPKMLKAKQGYLQTAHVGEVDLRFCVMELINGENMFASGHMPNDNELRFIARQAALINKADIRPKSPFYDSWAIVNIQKEFKEKGKYLSPEDRRLIKLVVEAFESLTIERLPHCFVHGDILTTNTIVDQSGKLWIVDFSVSNYYPRLVELAVMAADLMFDVNSKEESEREFKLGLKEYEKLNKLTDEERKLLPLFIRAAHAMHVISTNYEKVVKGTITEENEEFFKSGKIGLRQTSQ